MGGVGKRSGLARGLVGVGGGGGGGAGGSCAWGLRSDGGAGWGPVWAHSQGAVRVYDKKSSYLKYFPNFF